MTGGCQKNSKFDGIMLYVIFERTERLGLVDRLPVDRVVRASRTRRSCHGDFGSHCSTKYTQ
jgi:hypothetical protein